MRLHSSIQSRILSLLFLLYTLDNNYTVAESLEHFLLFWVSERNVRVDRLQSFLLNQCLLDLVQSVFVLDNLESFPLILEGRKKGKGEGEGEGEGGRRERERKKESVGGTGTEGGGERGREIE